MRNPKTKKSKEPSQRQLRIAEQIRHMLSQALRTGHFMDPALQNTGEITVTSVDISPDLKNAAAYIVPLGGKNEEAIIKALNRASGFFKREIGKNMELRFTPRISFKTDSSFAEAQHVNNLLIKERSRRSASEVEADTESDHEDG